MIRNDGFLIKNDRFSLTEKDLYVLRGHLAPGTDLEAFLDGESFPLEVKKLTQNVDERYGGSECVVNFRIPEDIDSYRKLKVYAVRDQGRRLCFEIAASDLAVKMNGIKLFVDDFTVNTKDGYLRLQGWAVSTEPVEMVVLDSQKKKIKCNIERYKRLDVADLFDEYEIDPVCGFHIELRPIPKHLPSERVLAKQRKDVFDPAPLFSVVVPLYKTPEDFLVQLVDSVKAQSYANWELILSDGSGEDTPLSDVLDRLEASDSRIRAVRNNKQLRIAENTNAAIAAARGDYIAFADHDDLLTPNALYENAAAIRENPAAELLYSDEDKIGIGEKYMQPNMKPDFDPDFLRSVNYICHLLVAKKSLIDKVGMLDPAYDGAQDYDFVLRCTEATDNIVHIPKILYHWRFFEGSTAANPESKTYAFEAGRRAIEAHYSRLGLPATVLMGEYPGIYRTVYHWEGTPCVSILIPNKDHIDDLDKCLKSIDRGVRYPNLEIIIIENNSTEEDTFLYYRDLMERDDRVKVVYYEGGFNFSAINNFGAKEAKGEYLFLLNNDTEFISDDVIGEMLSFCRRDDVGAVGARLYYEDNTIQHAGVIVGWGGIAGHAFVNQNRGETGYQHRIICQQDLSAVTAACLMVKKSVYDEVGGLTEELAVAFNDIDFCMKIRRAGYLIVYDPFAELYHYESKSRGLDQGNPEKVARFQNEMAIFQKRWPEILRDGDPYYNPNLSMVTQDFSLKRN